MSVGPRDYSSFSPFRFLALLLEAADYLKLQDLNSRPVAPIRRYLPKIRFLNRI